MTHAATFCGNKRISFGSGMTLSLPTSYFPRDDSANESAAESAVAVAVLAACSAA